MKTTNLTFLTLLTVIVSTSQVLAQTPSPKVLADQMNQLGIEKAQSGQLGAAFQSFQMAIKLYQQAQDRQGEGRAMGNLGLVYKALGDYAKAIEAERQWVTIAEEIHNPQDEATALKTLGNTYADLGDTSSATLYYEQALLLTKKHHRR